MHVAFLTLTLNNNKFSRSALTLELHDTHNGYILNRTHGWFQ